MTQTTVATIHPGETDLIIQYVIHDDDTDDGIEIVEVDAGGHKYTWRNLPAWLREACCRAVKEAK